MCRLSSVQVSQEGGGDLKVEAAEQAGDGEKKKKKPGPRKKRAPVSGRRQRQHAARSAETSKVVYNTNIDSSRYVTVCKDP